jgi:hypothetical protein
MQEASTLAALVENLQAGLPCPGSLAGDMSFYTSDVASAKCGLGVYVSADRKRRIWVGGLKEHLCIESVSRNGMGLGVYDGLRELVKMMETLLGSLGGVAISLVFGAMAGCPSRAGSGLWGVVQLSLPSLCARGVAPAQALLIAMGLGLNGQQGNAEEHVLDVIVVARPGVTASEAVVELSKGLNELITAEAHEASRGFEPNPFKLGCVTGGRAVVTTDLKAMHLRGFFPTICFPQFMLTRGKFYYEIELLTDGIMHLGWASPKFASSFGGIGYDPCSWAYDGSRQQRWHITNGNWGAPWALGDCVGCLLDVTAGEISFCLNGSEGSNMGRAFTGLSVSAVGGAFFPGVSLGAEQLVQFNFAGPFKHVPPVDYQPVQVRHVA